MLLARIIGPCPKCGTPNGFGNVNVTARRLNRGCTACGYSTFLPLPPIRKQIIYLDQFFFSHAFRDGTSEFATAIELLRHLARHQLIVVPFSPIHKTETNQWPSERSKSLWEFIKLASRGQQFSPTYHARHNQVLRSFGAFLKQGLIDLPVSIDDVSHDDFHTWEDYIWIDVSIDREDSSETRASKLRIVENLLDLFDGWRGKPSEFNADFELELNASAQNYLSAFAKTMGQVASGDPNAFVTSPLDSMVVERMLMELESIDHPIQRLNKICEFFSSQYFRRVPYELISNGILASLKHRGKMGQFSNRDKARDALSGIVFDVDFISSYMPYCDAMFIDQAMFEIVKDPRLSLGSVFPTRIFSKTNWEDFLNYLAAVEKGLSPMLRRAIDWVYPENAVGAKA